MRGPNRVAALLAAVIVAAAGLPHRTTTTASPPIPGSDPTGQVDSSAALNTHLRSRCNATNPDGRGPKGAVAPAPVVIDLAGGIYRLDSPLRFDAATVKCVGPVTVRDGTLLAGQRLQPEEFLVEAVDYIGARMVGMPLTFDRVVFASNFTGGGLLANRSSFTTVTNCNFVNFATFGVWSSGADFRLDRSVLMECTAGMEPCSGPSLKATAVYIDGADSHFNRNVVACTHVGMVNANGDNMYHQNHIWTNCRPPSQDDGHNDSNQLGFLVSGGSPQIDGGAIDNCHLVITSYRGVMVTNTHFNEVAQLVLAPPSTPPQPITPDGRCQYWRGAVCSLRVVGNTFTCGGASVNGVPGSCGRIVQQYTPPQAMQIEVSGNTWENASSSVCSQMDQCVGAACAHLLGDCTGAPRNTAPQPPRPAVLGGTWIAAAKVVCTKHGFTLRGLAGLPETERVAVITEAGLSPLARLRVLAAAHQTALLLEA